MFFISKILLFFFILTFLFGYSSFTFAQGRIVCDEPIPIGVTLKELGDLMNELYTELRAITGYIDSAGEHMKGVVTDLSQGGPRICDYSKCTPIVNLVSPDFGFTIKLPFGKEIKLPPADKGLTLPFCMPQKCIGEPCPDLEREADTLRQLTNGIESSFKKLKKIILEENVIVTEDLNETPEEVGSTITQAESVKRNLAISRLWVHPGERAIDIYSATHDKKEIIGRKSCTLGDWERQQIAAGKIVGYRFPMQCREALQQGLYWPRPWSELCHYQCKYGINNECIECLRDSRNNKKTASVLAKINYWIYKNCGDDCCKKEAGKWKKCEFTEECYGCLCGGTNLTQKKENECLDWICGGSEANFVCCHETPLEFRLDITRILVEWAKEFPVIIPGIKGFDIYAWSTGGINWPEIKQAGYKFVFTKATEGKKFSPYRLEQNIKNVKEALAQGMYVGIYHFGRPFHNTADEEAEFFVKHFEKLISGLDQLSKDKLLIPALDIEDYSNYKLKDFTSEQLSNWIKKWMEKVEEKIGVTPLLYIQSSYAKTLIKPEITKYPLWIAHWNQGIRLPDAGVWKKQGKDWVFWQWTDRQLIEVAREIRQIDVNLFYSADEEDLKKFTFQNLLKVK